MVKFHNLNFILGIAFLCVSSGAATSGWAQQENFDSITAPVLPDGWESSSTSAGTRWTTVSDQSDTAPNSVFFHGRNSADRTTINSPTYYRPRAFTTVTFRHKFGFEQTGSNNYDGGRLYLPTGFGSYGEEFDLLTQGGSFVQGGYNGNIFAGSGSFVPNAPAWVGASVGFITTTFSLPPNLTNTFQHLSFGFQSDSSVLSPAGWWIDSISFAPSINLQLSQSINPSPAILGAPAEWLITVNNPSSLVATNIEIIAVIPNGFTPSSVSSSSGVGNLGTNTLQAIIPSIQAAGSAVVTVKGTVQAATGSGNLLRVTAGEGVVKRAYGLRYVPFSSPPANGVISAGLSTSFDFTSPVDDACQVQALGSSPVGKIGVAAGGNCSITTKALNMQNAGEIAAIIISTNDDMIISNETGAGITIPVFLVSLTDADPLRIAASSGHQAELSVLLSTMSGAAIAIGDQFDPSISSNFSDINVFAEADTDGDGTGNAADACPTNSAKVSPGVCGCGTADSDLNNNGVIDCLVSQDLKATIGDTLKKVKQLKSLSGLSGKKRTAQRKLRAALKSAMNSMKSTLLLNISLIPKASAGVNLGALQGKAKKAVSKATSAGSSTIKQAKSGAAKSLKALLKGIA